MKIVLKSRCDQHVIPFFVFFRVRETRTDAQKKILKIPSRVVIRVNVIFVSGKNLISVKSFFYIFFHVQRKIRLFYYYFICSARFDQLLHCRRRRVEHAHAT